MKVFVQCLLLLFPLTTISTVASTANAAIRCYQCSGYDSSRPEKAKRNNPHCPTASFNADEILTTTLPRGALCFKADFILDGVEMTARGASTSIEMDCKEGSINISGKQLNGTICGCTDNLCNTAENTLVTVSLLAGMLVLARFLS
ncbi:uncharacterized protein LOC143027201 [Oratosquilla oratoria]|uniref:uncharacterized protein LOC143027201 n=1 Tax=Oratosquilla oratoria TaxID=337810 RepID=UPI003F76B705